MRIINPIIFHFILEMFVKQNGISMFEFSACSELKFISQGDICSVIISFSLAVLEIYSI